MSTITEFRLVPAVAGVLFGAGLTLGGMTDPARVRGFLDLFGAWDPTLAFVMGGALVVMAIAWAVQRRMARPAFAPGWSLPDRRDLDRGLVAGSALFGIGWGLAGICPGPGIAALAIAPGAVAPFLAAMVAGMMIYRRLETRSD